MNSGDYIRYPHNVVGPLASVLFLWLVEKLASRDVCE